MDFSSLDNQSEVAYYTINGETLNNSGKVLYDLTEISIHMIDHVFDEKEIYDYIKNQIAKTREDLDDGKELEAAARVISMQLILGIEVNMKSVLKEIEEGRVSFPEEFSSDSIRKVVDKKLLNDEDSMFRGNK